MRCLFLIFFIVSGSFLAVNDADALAYFPPPLKQISNNVLPENVTCTEGLVIILKSSNNLPACVKPSSVEELVQRGWATEIFLQQPVDFASLVFQNGLIYTVNEDNLWAESIAIKNGVISFVGTNDDIQNYINEDTQVVDLEGKLMMPGIHDVHLHILEASSEFGGDCMLDDSDPEEFVLYLQECSSRQTERDWLVGWGHSILSLESSQRTPLEIIDEAIPDRPAIMLEQTSHSVWVNSPALELAGFDNNSVDPASGILGRDLETGKLNGILYENAGEIVMDLALTRTPEIDESNYRGLLFGLKLLAENGITSITDAKVNLDRGFDDIWKRAEAEGNLTVRAVMGIWTHPHQDDDYQIDRIKSLYSNDLDSLLKFTQVKMYSDGLLESGTAKLVDPYPDDIGFGDGYGVTYFEEERMTHYITELENVGFDFHIHALGDGAVRESLNAIESAKNKNSNADTRHRLTHIELVHISDIDRFEKLGVIADFQVAGEWTLPENNGYLKEIIGEPRLMEHIPVRSVYDTGAIVTLSSDYDVGSLSPFVGMQHALSRDHQSMPDLESVIESYTINGAYLMRQEDKTGSIEVGKFADLIVVNQNIFEISIDKIGETKVLSTYLEGEQIFPIDTIDVFDSVSNDLNSEDEIAEKAKEILDYALAQEQSISEGKYIEGPTDDGYSIVFYDVFGNDIVLNKSPSLPSDLLYLQQDAEKHREIWNTFTKLIPESSRNVNVFYLTTDGEDGIGGGVERDVDDTSMWNLFYDILDVYPDEFIDDKEMIYTTIHEYGHIVTSGTDQIDVDLHLINSSDDENFDALFQIKSESCYPNVLVSDGCAKSASYINLFYQKFWTDIVAEWDDIQYIEDENEFVEQSDLFYEKYQDQFVSVYSSTNIDEDIAESWTAFVLNDKPLGVAISEQKIGFFYDFPELVEIRDHIRKELI